MSATKRPLEDDVAVETSKKQKNLDGEASGAGVGGGADALVTEMVSSTPVMACVALVSGRVQLANPHQERVQEENSSMIDHLYHLGLDSSLDLKSMFGSTQFVCMGGSHVRAERMANQVIDALELDIPTGLHVYPVGKTERYYMYKVGPVICVNHGMGMPSMSILLHEVTKLLHYAEAENVTYMRIGTSGGLGVPPGTVVVAQRAFNGLLEPYHELHVMGQRRRYSSEFDHDLAQTIYDMRGDINARLGTTIGTDCFYEGQGRLDGALCDYTDADKMAWLQKAHEAGAINIEMEATYLAAFCGRLGIRAALLCTTLLNRLEGDQVTSTPEQLKQFSKNAETLALRYVRSVIKGDTSYGQ